jgi:hypothetical protein
MIYHQFLSLAFISLAFIVLYVALLRHLTVLHRKVAKVGSFLTELTFSYGTHGGEPTYADKLYLRPAWKPDDCHFRELTLASGAKWSCDARGYWHLIEANGAKKEAAVREFLHCFGLHGRFFAQSGIEERVYVSRLATLLELGLDLPMEYLQSTAQTKGPEGDQYPLRSPEGKRGKTTGAD